MDAEQLQERLGQYERLFAYAGWGVAVGAPDGSRLLEVSQTFAAMHGYDVAELTGADSTIVFAPESAPKKLTEFVGVPNQQGYHRYESLHQRKDGSTFWCLTDVMAVRDEADNVRHRVGVFVDLTEQKRHEAELRGLNQQLAAQAAELSVLYEREQGRRAVIEAEVAQRTQELSAANEELQAQSEELQSQAEELTAAQAEQIDQLRELDRYKDEFLSVISHELRTPLNFIMGFASVLDDEVSGPLNPRQHEQMAKILTGSDRMLALVDDLLDFAKIQSGSFEIVPEPTPYAPLVDEVLGLMRSLAEPAGLTLTADCQVASSPVIDGPRVAQVLTNLLSNAIKFTPPGGSVRVAVQLEDECLRTAVSDTGHGIAAADLPKLFNRFQQLDMSVTRQAGGTGLGLAIAKALVEAHGGEIGVESSPGQGSTFWFTLPFRPVHE